MPKITKRMVDALIPSERERVVWDNDLKGFGVRRPSHRPQGLHRQVPPRGPRRQGDHRTARSHYPGGSASPRRRDCHPRQDRARPRREDAPQ